jgi:hypothetical protein
MENWNKAKKKPSFNWNWKNKDKAHFGMPVKLFGDKDRDNVPNVFDCKPRNPKRQDVIAPPRMAGDVFGMYHRREAGRFAREQARRQAEFIRKQQELEEQRIVAELKRVATPAPVTYTTKVSYFGSSGSGSGGLTGGSGVSDSLGTQKTITQLLPAKIPVIVTREQAPAPKTPFIQKVAKFFGWKG